MRIGTSIDIATLHLPYARNLRNVYSRVVKHCVTFFLHECGANVSECVSRVCPCLPALSVSMATIMWLLLWVASFCGPTKTQYTSRYFRPQANDDIPHVPKNANCDSGAQGPQSPSVFTSQSPNISWVSSLHAQRCHMAHRCVVRHRVAHLVRPTRTLRARSSFRDAVFLATIDRSWCACYVWLQVSARIKYTSP